MTNFVIDDADDALLDHIANNVTTLHVCTGDPTTRAAAISNSVGSVAIDNTDFTKAAGDVSGRKHTLAQQSIPSASASGLGAILCLIDGTDLLYKSDFASTQTITSGNPITVNAHDHEVRDPA